jgi:hypothetical protein
MSLDFAVCPHLVAQMSWWHLKWQWGRFGNWTTETTGYEDIRAVKISSKHTIMEQMISQNILNNLVRSMTKRGTRHLKRPGATLAARSTEMLGSWSQKRAILCPFAELISATCSHDCFKPEFRHYTAWFLRKRRSIVMPAEQLLEKCIEEEMSVCLDWATELTSGPII